MNYEIKNHNGEIVSEEELDQEAHAFWGTLEFKGFFASPIGFHEKEHMEDHRKLPKEDRKLIENIVFATNWRDYIASQAHTYAATPGEVHWNIIRTQMLAAYEEGDSSIKPGSEFYDCVLQPMLDLIEYWEEQGYTIYKT